MSDVNAVGAHPRETRRLRRKRKVPQWKADRLQEQLRQKEADLGIKLNGGTPSGRDTTFSQRDFDQARQVALRDNIRMLVQLLSETLKNHAGEDLLDFVERIRLLSKARRTDDPLAMFELNAIIEDLIHDLPRTQTILKAFALYFQLVNIAEEQQRVRVLRHRARVSQEQGVSDRENIAFATHWLFQEGVSTEEMRQLLDALSIKPVFTAHPTEANRRTVLFKHKVISDVLTELDLIDLTPEEEAARLRLISENILSLWQTDENREQKPTVIDEVQHGLYYLSNSVFELIPHVYRELEKQIRQYFPRIDAPVPIFLRYGSWIGGDRDGNPFVTYRETQRTLEEQQRRLIDLYIAEVNILYAHLSMSVNHSEFTDEFLDHLRAATERLPRRELASVRKVRREPYRQMFTIIRRRLEATRRRADELWTDQPDDPMAYASPGELADDLEAVADSLRRSKGELLASGRVARLITSVQVCGLHFDIGHPAAFRAPFPGPGRDLQLLRRGGAAQLDAVVGSGQDAETRRGTHLPPAADRRPQVFGRHQRDGPGVPHHSPGQGSDGRPGHRLLHHQHDRECQPGPGSAAPGQGCGPVRGHRHRAPVRVH